jgi:hypothetical protein
LAEVLVPLQADPDCHATGQEAHFRRAFAPDAALYGHRGVHCSRNSAGEYIARAASGRPATDEPRRKPWIHSGNVNGRFATAVIERDYPGMKALDQMRLIRDAGACPNAPLASAVCDAGTRVAALGAVGPRLNLADGAAAAGARHHCRWRRAARLPALTVRDRFHGDQVGTRALVRQHKTQRPVQFEISQAARAALQAWIKPAGLKPEDVRYPSRLHGRRPNWPLRDAGPNW